MARMACFGEWGSQFTTGGRAGSGSVTIVFADSTCDHTLSVARASEREREESEGECRMRKIK